MFSLHVVVILDICKLYTLTMFLNKNVGNKNIKNIKRWKDNMPKQKITRTIKPKISSAVSNSLEIGKK